MYISCYILGQYGTYSVFQKLEALRIHFEISQALKHDLVQNGQLVVVPLDRQRKVVHLRVEGVAESCQIGIVRVFSKRVFDQVGEQAGFDGCGRRGRDAGHLDGKVGGGAGQPPPVVLLVPQLGSFAVLDQVWSPLRFGHIDLVDDVEIAGHKGVLIGQGEPFHFRWCFR
jgi:hypothetical protein